MRIASSPVPTYPDIVAGHASFPECAPCPGESVQAGPEWPTYAVTCGFDLLRGCSRSASSWSLRHQYVVERHRPKMCQPTPTVYCTSTQGPVYTSLPPVDNLKCARRNDGEGHAMSVCAFGHKLIIMVQAGARAPPHCTFALSQLCSTLSGSAAVLCFSSNWLAEKQPSTGAALPAVDKPVGGWLLLASTAATAA